MIEICLWSHTRGQARGKAVLLLYPSTFEQRITSHAAADLSNLEAAACVSSFHIRHVMISTSAGTADV